MLGFARSSCKTVILSKIIIYKKHNSLFWSIIPKICKNIINSIDTKHITLTPHVLEMPTILLKLHMSAPYTLHMPHPQRYTPSHIHLPSTTCTKQWHKPYKTNTHLFTHNNLIYLDHNHHSYTQNACRHIDSIKND